MFDANNLQNPLKSQISHILPSSRAYLRSTTLSIATVSQLDSGIYRCRAQNEKGHSDAAVELDILGKS